MRVCLLLVLLVGIPQHRLTRAVVRMLSLLRTVRRSRELAGTCHTRAPPPTGGTLFQVMTGSGSPWELQGSCTLVPTSTVMSLGMLANTGVTAKQGTMS